MTEHLMYAGVSESVCVRVRVCVCLRVRVLVRVRVCVNMRMHACRVWCWLCRG